MFRWNLENMLCGILSLMLVAFGTAAWAAEEEAKPDKPAPAVPAEDPVSDAAPAEEAVEAAVEEAVAEKKEDSADAEEAAPQAKSPEEIIQQFMEYVSKREDVPSEKRTEIKKEVESLQEDPYSQDVIVTLVQRELSPEFSAALDHLVNEDLPAAQESLTKLTESEDPYLAAESSFYLARSYIMEDKYERALPRL